ncbi:RNA-guided pseudouridylation complex pseudouridine synthase subunit Cbf5 [Candidatus Woesearchaeota archaeon]|nr:RNA-guided pseudouridylation complex pseudouridine synthase subunit Cbf5 [Candidatus Woesearchaeota archaeon]
MEFPFEKRKFEIYKRTEGSTNSQYGKRPEDRSIEELLNYGLIILNKPQGPTSHQVTDTVKQILHLEKAGHSGTLDPNVTGALVIALGKSTRVVEALLKAGKEYVCLMHIHEPVEEKKIRDAFKDFLGKIQQMPPMKSAVKRQLRTREIYYLDILEIQGQDVLFRVGCQAGTYIRTICVDMGRRLETKAHMQELVRTKVSTFTDQEWISLHDLKDAWVAYEEGNDAVLKQIIHPIERAVDHMKKLWLIDTAVDTICHGAFLSVPGIAKLESDIELNDQVALLTVKGELVAIGTAKMNAQNMWKQQKGIAIVDNKVFMSRGIYPKFQKREKNE